MVPSAKVTLFHAFDVPFEGFVDDKAAARAAMAGAAMAESQAFLAATPAVAASGRNIDTICEYGDASALLQDLSQARGVDLVALGTEGRTGLAHVLLGSVAERLLKSLPVDTLVLSFRTMHIGLVAQWALEGPPYATSRMLSRRHMALLAKGLVSKGALVKVLGRGEVSRALTVRAHAFSKSAEAAITGAGGTVERLDLPFKVRPAFHGSAHTNR